MGALYLDRKNLKLSLSAGRLVIEEPDERPRSVPLKLLERVVIQGRAELDTGLLAALGEQGISVLCLSARHSRRAGFLLGPGHADARRRLAQYRLAEQAEQRLAWSLSIITLMEPPIIGVMEPLMGAPEGCSNWVRILPLSLWQVVSPAFPRRCAPPRAGAGECDNSALPE